MPVAVVLPDETISTLKVLREHTEQGINHISVHELVRIQRGKRKPIGDVPEHKTAFPISDEYVMQIVMSIEEHPGGWMRHASYSFWRVDDHSLATQEIVSDDNFVIGSVVEMVLQTLGFPHMRTSYIESNDDGSIYAVNILSRYPKNSVHN